MFCYNLPRLARQRSSLPILFLSARGQVRTPPRPALHSPACSLYSKVRLNGGLKSIQLYYFKATDTFLLEKTNSIVNNQIRSLKTSSNCNDDKPEREDGNPGEMSVKLLALMAGLLGVTMVFLTFVARRMSSERTIHMSWDTFVNEVLSTGEVRYVFIRDDNGKRDHLVAVLHHDATIHSRPVRRVQVTKKGERNIEESLREEERKLGISPQSFIPCTEYRESLLSDLPVFAIFGAVLLISSIFFFRASRNLSSKMPPTNMKPPRDSPREAPQRPPAKDKFNAGSIFKMFDTDVNYAKKTDVKFEDVAGMHEAKQEVMEFVQFLKNPEVYQRLGAKMPHGCLLTGPPGVGKTLLAKAVASESDVPFIAKAGSDFVEMIGGLGARRIRQVFEKAREAAPCIIYIDELDALGAQRSGTEQFSSASSEKDQTLNQILVEMDGMLSRQHQVIVLASTNRVDILDKALLRPGRFDRLVQIDLPTRIERREILDRHLENVKLLGKPREYSEQLANETPGMSGADLANICNEAAIYAAREDDAVVDKKHLDYALERVTSGAPKSTTSLSPEERRKVAVHESGHALVGWLLEHTNALAKITIIPRSSGALGVTRTLPSEKLLRTPEQLFDNMCMALGGRAAENLIFGHVTDGAQDDLQKVTKMAYAQVKQFGFNASVGPLSFQEEGQLQTRPYSNALQTIIDVEATKLVTRAYETTQKLLSENKAKLERLSAELLSRETLSYDDVMQLIGAPAYGAKKQVPVVPFAQEVDESPNEPR